MKKNNFLYILFLVGTLLSINTLGYSKPTTNFDKKVNQEDKKENFPVDEIRTFAEVFSQVKANYYKDVTGSKLLENAMRGMVSALDPHSDYMDSNELNDLKDQTSGEFGGLGIQVMKKDNAIKVIAPIEGSPAAKAGIKSGDYIIKIDDESTNSLTLMESVKKMKGKPGTKIKITISRINEVPFDVVITRDIIKTESVKTQLLSKDYGYVRLTQFQEKTLNELVSGLKSLEKENKGPLKGLILDLRNNPGGLLNMAVGISTTFLPKNQLIVKTKQRDGSTEKTWKSNRYDYILGYGVDPLDSLNGNYKKIPIVVLINSGSASASEIVTGALQDYKRVVVVGTQSFGKGSVQTVIPLNNGGGIKLTTALYYTPNDRSIQAKGIVPDIKVEDKNSLFEIREADLSGHLSNPYGEKEVKGKITDKNQNMDKNKDNKKEDSSTKKKKDDEDIDSSPFSLNWKPDPSKDVQLQKAMEVVKNQSLYNKSIGLYKNLEKTSKLRNETEEKPLK